MNPLKVVIGLALVASLLVPAFADEDNDKAPSYKSSVQASHTPDSEGQEEKAEQAALAQLAKITPAQAQAAAMRSTKGMKLSKIELENVDGNVVYEVELKNGPKAISVIVDAGNGNVLATEEDND